MGDNGSADLLEDILDGEEEHTNWLEGQLTAIGRSGVPRGAAQGTLGESSRGPSRRPASNEVGAELKA